MRGQKQPVWVAILLALACAAAAFATGCGGGQVDATAEQGMQSERQGRALVERETDMSLCDASLLFGHAKALYSQSSRPQLASRGDTLLARFSPHCERRVARFWERYQGCATPIQGRELQTIVFWDEMRMTAFQQYGLPNIATIIANGRARWQAQCPADFQAVTAGEAGFRAQAPMPVPLNAIAPTPAAVAAANASPSQADPPPPPPPTIITPPSGPVGAVDPAVVAVVRLMAAGQHEQARAMLATMMQAGPNPVVIFNLGACYESLGQTEQAIALYRQVGSDPAFGPHIEARVRALAAPSAPSQQALVQARDEFNRGLQLANGASPAQAIAAFHNSFTAVPHPRTVLNIAVAHHRMNQMPVAISYYLLVVNYQGPGLDEGMRQSAQQAVNDFLAAASGGQPPPPTAAQ